MKLSHDDIHLLMVEWFEDCQTISEAVELYAAVYSDMKKLIVSRIVELIAARNEQE